MADFSSTNLTATTFSKANLKNVSFRNALLIDVDFSQANLCNADLTNTTITDKQLQSALSIRNARLPNGTLGRARNLLHHSNSNCKNMPVSTQHVRNVNVTVLRQRIKLIDVWDADNWPDSNVEFHFHRIDGIAIELRALDANGTILHQQFSSKFFEKSSE